MTMYDVMYDVITEQYENGDITFEQANELNDLAYDKYVTEKKSTAEYRLQKFKKAHDYDPKTNTVQLGNHRVHLKYIGGSKKYSTPIKTGINMAIDNNGAVLDKYSTLELDNRALNQKHPKTIEYIAGHEQGHIGAQNMKVKHPDVYTKSYNKYKGFINNQTKKGIVFNSHSGSPDEYIADDVGRRMSSDKIAKDGLKDLHKSTLKHMKYLDKKDPGKREREQKKWENSDMRKDFEKNQKISMDMCNSVLANKNESPARRAQFAKYKEDLKNLARDMRNDTEPEKGRKSNLDNTAARMKALVGNIRLDYKKNLPDRKFIQDRGRIKMVKDK